MEFRSAIRKFLVLAVDQTQTVASEGCLGHAQLGSSICRFDYSKTRNTDVLELEDTPITRRPSSNTQNHFQAMPIHVFLLKRRYFYRKRDKAN